ncbi:MAG: amino acid adenylation domain-containing protein [Xanthomonadaceae bacterium]|nr:amino acid adenylation domain-containing protein [Xanthomonadaceae bacterium]
MPRLLQDWVTDHAQRLPDATAVVLDRDRLSYGDLEVTSSRLANLLVARGCSPGDRVCLLMPKTPLAIAAIIGIYKAGCVYVPLDPTSPAARLAAIIRACEASWVVAAGPVGETIGALYGEQGIGDALRVAWLDTVEPGAVPVAAVWADACAAPAATVPRARADSPAHILFTSGSTGVPKGVVITHENVVSFVEWAVREFCLDESDRVSGHSPLAFDLSVFDIFGALAVGAELHLVPERCRMLPQRLAEWVRDSRLTQWFSVPAVMNYMSKFDVVRQDDFPTLRRVMWCGEVLPTPSLQYWMRKLPHASFTNLYGPTETTIASSYYRVPACPQDETAEIPIGLPCDGEALAVLDGSGRPVRPGVTGELYIKGIGLSPGYWRNPQATKLAFVINSTSRERMYRTGDRARVGEDGLFYYAGREDAQVKSRGYRIELGEIEAALNAVRILREAAVTAVPSADFDAVVLCCSYVPQPGQPVTPATLRNEVARWLPPYMIPSRWKAYRQLPRNATGKIDRNRLKEDWRGDVADAA